MAEAVWQGTEQEFLRLRNALARHCNCVGTWDDNQWQTCAPHAMLGSQAALDHLLYVFRVRGLFVRREFYALRRGSRAK